MTKQEWAYIGYYIYNAIFNILWVFGLLWLSYEISKNILYWILEKIWINEYSDVDK